MYCDREVPMGARVDEELVGEGFGGASFWNAFVETCRDVGFKDIRIVKREVIEIPKKLSHCRQALLGDCVYYSVTVRLFKVEGLRSYRDDYGQTATYLGGLPHLDQQVEKCDEKPHACCEGGGGGKQTAPASVEVSGGDGAGRFEFDSEYTFPVQAPVSVDGNLALVLKASRFAKYFKISDRGIHRGAFQHTSS
eukprot:Filipodium_phascolosomae@DN7821_c0_g1_i1.p1